MARRSDRWRGKQGLTFTRRQLLAGSVGAAAATFVAPWDAGAAPAQIRGTSLRILLWSHFVPAFDTYFDKFAADWGKANGVDVRVDHINIYDLPARVASELSAGAGHDIVQMVGVILTTLFYKNWVDISDICTRVGERFGGWLPIAENVARVGGHWYALPDFYIPQPLLWRTDLFREYGLKPPSTWDDLLGAARVGKAKGHPAGMAISHCNDANHNWRAVFYAFGVKETDPSGRELQWDSKELREAMKYSRALWQDGMTSEVFSWDDASDNRYLDSGVAVWIHDAISAIRSIQDTDPTLYKNVDIGTPSGLEPGGPAGRFNVVDPAILAIWRFSKNIPAAREFLEYWGSHIRESMVGSKGYNMPMLRGMYKKPMPALADDPKVELLQDWLKVTAVFGYPGPATAPASEVLATFVVPDMVARYCHSNDLEGSVRWGLDQIKRIYAKYR